MVAKCGHHGPTNQDVVTTGALVSITSLRDHGGVLTPFQLRTARAGCGDREYAASSETTPLHSLGTPPTDGQSAGIV